MFKKLFNFKREVDDVAEDATFVPFSTRGVQYSGAYSPVVARCLKMYSSFLAACPLECDKDNSLFQLMKKRPYPPISRQNFFEVMAQNYFLYEGFFAVIMTNTRGEIEALCPYIDPTSFQVYPKGYQHKKELGDASHVGGEWVDPISIYEKGYYFRDYKGRLFNQDEAMFIKNNLFNTQNILEQQNVFQRVFTESFNAPSLLEAVIGSICRSDLKAPLVLTGLGFSGESKGANKASGRETKRVKEALRKFFSGKSQGYDSGVLALPPGYKIDKLNLDNPAGLIAQLNVITLANVCNIFQVPTELVYSGQTERTAKEARRFWLGGAFAAFCRVIEEELDRLCDFQCSFRFNTDRLRSALSDIREEAAMSQLLGIFTKEELKKRIEAF